MAETNFVPSEGNNYGSVPAQVIYAPPSYQKMDPEADGSWYWVLEGKNPVAVLWTDWLNGVGLVKTQTNEVTEALLRYLQTNKQMGAAASSAFVSAKNVPGVKLSEQESGRLGDVLDKLPDADNKEDN